MAGRWSSLWDGCRQPSRAAYPQLERPGPGLAAYLALLRPGVAVPRLLPGARWALTPPFHPYPLDTRAVCSLWPCPSPFGAQALPGGLPCGARTFLGWPLQPATRDHRTPPLSSRRKLPAADPPGQDSPRQTPYQATQAVGTHAGKPETVVFHEGHASQPWPIDRGGALRGEPHGRQRIDAARPILRQQVPDARFTRPQQDGRIGRGQSPEQSEGEPVTRHLSRAEGEPQIRINATYLRA